MTRTPNLEQILGWEAGVAPLGEMACVLVEWSSEYGEMVGMLEYLPFLPHGRKVY